jgi:hypothetical protein
MELKYIGYQLNIVADTIEKYKVGEQMMIEFGDKGR